MFWVISLAHPRVELPKSWFTWVDSSLTYKEASLLNYVTKNLNTVTMASTVVQWWNQGRITEGEVSAVDLLIKVKCLKKYVLFAIL